MHFRSAGCVKGVMLSMCLAISLQSQNPKADSATPTFKSKVRVVLVDVVVTNGKGDPVPDLHQDDFQVLEDGQPQKIASFEEHQGAAPTFVKLPPMGPNEFTNFPTTAAADSVNVILLDALNTTNANQIFVRAQMIKYLKDMKPGPRLAVFTLGSRLRMLQGFTTDPAALLAALDAKKSRPETSQLLKTEGEAQTEADFINFLRSESATQEAIDSMKQFEAESAAFQNDARVRVTLEALQQLGRYLSAIPGRKNLMWFSSSFPISIFPDDDTPDQMNVARQYGPEIQKTADLLTNAQVAVYPLGAEGLYTTSLDASTQTRFGLDDAIQVREQQRDRQNAIQDRVASHNAMELLAKETGGEAIYDTNGLNGALAKMIDHGSRYYTLTYTPSDPKTDGSFRRIQVKLEKGSYKIAYRRGYYAENGAAAAPTDEKPASTLLPMMVRGLPDFTEILYKIHVAALNPQPKADAPIAGGNSSLKHPVTRYGVDFGVAAQDLKLDPAADGSHHGTLEVALVAYDPEGIPANWVIRRYPLSIKPDVYAEMLKSGMHAHLEIDIPEGDLFLRTGLHDAGSGKIGTLGIPLAQVNARPTLKAATAK
jgi:VWFA-related protein